MARLECDLRAARWWVFLLLVLAGCAGCASVRTKDEAAAGECACVRVETFWRDPAGVNHAVNGLRVTLVQMDGPGAPSRIEAETTLEGWVELPDLEPATWTVTVANGDREYFSQVAMLRPGTRLKIKANVTGRLAGEKASRAADAAGKAAVVIADASLSLAIVALEVAVEVAPIVLHGHGGGHFEHHPL